jgi:PKD repeat protein
MCAPVQFYGDANGGCGPYTWAWTFGDGGTSTDKNPTHQYIADGTYTVTFTVTDSVGQTCSMSTTATITTTPVVCDAGGPYTSDVEHAIQFLSTVTGGCPPYTYAWTFGDGGTSTVANPLHQYTTAGPYTATFTVTDSAGQTCRDTALVTVLPAPLRCNIFGPYTGVKDVAVFFTASASGGYPPYTWAWTFGDGGTSALQNPSHTYLDYGLFTVTLTVTDSHQQVCKKTTTAIISPNAKEEQPTVFILYPNGGETLSGPVTVQYFVHDSQDEHWADLPLYLYYVDEDGNVAKIWQGTNGAHLDHNFLGTYAWDTTKVPDGPYRLLLEAVDSDGNVGHSETDPVTVSNHGLMTEDNAPNQPDRPSGNTNGKTDVEYTYSSNAVDSDGDQVWLLFDWGDNTNSGWLGPYNSGATCEAKHIWTEKSTYNVKVMAKDAYGKASSWSNPLPITMPYNYNPIPQFLQSLLERFPNAFPLLRQLLG